MGMTADSDPRTLAALSRVVGVSTGALRMWCLAAREPAKRVIDFVRLLRAVHLTTTFGWRLTDALDIVDNRSLLKLVRRGALTQHDVGGGLSVEEFLQKQKFLQGQLLIQEVVKRVAAADTATVHTDALS